MATGMDPLELPAELNIAAATELKETLLAAIDASESEITLDVSAVTRVDAAGIQLLAALCQTLRHADRAWRWVGESGEFADGVAQLGLKDELGLNAPTQN